MRITALIAVAVLLSASVANAADSVKIEEFSAYLAPHYFQWEEFLGRDKLLREQGWLTAAGGLLKLNLKKAETGSLVLTGRGELFGGVVGYDGQTQPPNPLPVQTDVTYFGTREDLDLGWRFDDAKVSMEPFAGIGVRWWLRDLQDSTTVNQAGLLEEVSGYTERWLSSYARFGARFGYRIDQDWSAFAEGGGNYRFYTFNRVDVAEDGTITIHPKGTWATFAEVGARYRQLKVSGFYEGFRFDQSNGVRSGNVILFQPRSESDIYGVRLSWVFK